MVHSKRRHCFRIVVSRSLQSPSTLCAWLQLAYNETSEGTLGPFNVEAKLTSVGGSVLYATGSGRVSPFENILYMF